MKKLAFAFIVLALLSSACGPSKKDITQLEQIETMAVENPDSAIALLDSLPCSALRNREFRSRATIAEAEAMYQNSEIMGKDSLLADAIDFYRLREKDPRRYRAYFLSGYQHYLKKEYGEAIIDYLNAEHTAALTTDTLALGLVYRAMGDTFEKMEDYTSALDFFKKSYDMFKAGKIERYFNFSKINLANAYYNAFYNDECINLLTDSLLLQYNDFKRVQADILFLKGQAFGAKQDLDSAIHYYNILKQNYSEFLTSKHWRNFGIISYNLGKVSEASIYNDSLLNIDPSDNWLEHLIAYNNGNYKQSYEILKEEFAESNEYFRNITKNDMRNFLLSYYLLQTNAISIENKNLKYKTIATITFISFILIIVIIMFMTYRFKQSKIMNTNMGIINDLTECLKKKNEELKHSESKKHNKVILSLPSTFNALDVLCFNYYTHDNSPSFQKRIYKETMEIIRKLQTGGSEIKELTSFIDDKTDGLYTRFCNENPNMNELEKRLFIFIVLGFSSTTISVLMGININQVYAKKTYLKNKIKKNQGENIDNFLVYF